MALGWLSADHSMRCLIVMPRPIADSGMLTPAFGGGGATGNTAALSSAVQLPPLKMRPDGNNQAAVDQVITHEEATESAADWP